MNTLLNERILKQFNRFALPVAVLWTLMSFLAFFLKTLPVERYASNEQPFFDLFRFSTMFGISAAGSTDKGYKTVTKEVLVGVPHRLKGIIKSSSGGYITVSDGKESTVVALHGTYKKDFILVGIGENQAIFRGHGKRYRLRLGFDDPLEEMQMVTTSISNPESKEGANEWRTIPRSELLAKSNDLKQLGKIIDIAPIENGGFRVVRIASGSLFDRFGLQQGDVVHEVNNKKMVNYAEALSVYREIPRMRSICISITRNNQKKDLIYEIAR